MNTLVAMRVAVLGSQNGGYLKKPDRGSESGCEEGSASDDEELGKTPLMFACEEAREDSVRQLLVNGADVNATCTGRGNTALHYACIDDKATLVRTRQTEKRVRTRRAIVEMLIAHGAAYKPNSGGMTPICCAGLSKMRELVKFMGDAKVALKGASSDEKIKGIEFLGVSSALYSSQVVQAYEFFLEAKMMRSQNRTPPGPAHHPEIEECFGRSEKDSPEALAEIKEDPTELEIEGYLIGARIFPKLHFPWNALFGFALDKMEKRKMAVLTCEKLMCLAVEKEVQKRVDVDQVLDEVHGAIKARKLVSPFFNACLANILEAFWRGLENAEIDWVRRKRRGLVKKLTMIVYHFATHPGTDTSTTEPLLVATEKILIRLCNPGCHPIRKRACLSSGCAWHFLAMFLKDMYVSATCIEETFGLIKCVFSRLLLVDGATYEEDRKTMLHQLSEALKHSPAEYFLHANFYGTRRRNQEDWERISLSLTRMVVRHGCPVTAKCPCKFTQVRSFAGWTAREYLIMGHQGWDETEENESPWQRELLQLVATPTRPLSLTELAARTILQYNVPYRCRLPRVLCEFVSGENCHLFND